MVVTFTETEAIPDAPLLPDKVKVYSEFDDRLPALTCKLVLLVVNEATVYFHAEEAMLLTSTDLAPLSDDHVAVAVEEGAVTRAAIDRVWSALTFDRSEGEVVISTIGWLSPITFTVTLAVAFRFPLITSTVTTLVLLIAPALFAVNNTEEEEVEENTSKQVPPVEEVQDQL